MSARGYISFLLLLWQLSQTQCLKTAPHIYPPGSSGLLGYEPPISLHGPLINLSLLQTQKQASKKHSFNDLTTIGQKSEWVQLVPLLWVSWGQNQSVGWVDSYLGRIHFQSHSGLLLGLLAKIKCSIKIIQVVGRIQFPMVIGLKFPFPCWLSSEIHSQLLEAAGISWLMALSVLKVSNSRSSLSHAWIPQRLSLLHLPVFHLTYTYWHRYTGYPACSFFFSPRVPISAPTVGQSLLCFIIHEFMIMLFNFI